MGQWVALFPEEPVVIQENVKTFSTDFVRRFLSGYYEIQDVIIESEAIGFPCKRTRKYVLLTHLVKVHAFRYPLNQFTRALERQNNMSWRHVFCADWFHLVEELEHVIRGKIERDAKQSAPRLAGGKRKRQSPEEKAAVEARIQAAFDRIDLDDDCCFERELPAFEHGVLMDYRRRFPNLAWSLNQNPKPGGRRRRAGGGVSIPLLPPPLSPRQEDRVRVAGDCDAPPN